VTLEHTHTNGTPTAGEENVFQVQFQSVAVGLSNGEAYYITAGASFGHEEYIWVAQAEVSADVTPMVSVERGLLKLNCEVCIYLTLH